MDKIAFQYYYKIVVRYLKDRLLIALAYYPPAQWEKMRKLSDDEPEFSTYREWRARFEERKKLLRQQGFSVKVVKLDAQEMDDYLRERGLKNTRRTRAEYIKKKIRISEYQIISRKWIRAEADQRIRKSGYQQEGYQEIRLSGRNIY